MSQTAELGVAMLNLVINADGFEAKLEAARSKVKITFGEIEAAAKRGAGSTADGLGAMATKIDAAMYNIKQSAHGAEVSMEGLARAVGIGFGAYEIAREGVRLLKEEVAKSLEAGKEAIANERELTLLAGEHANAVRALASAYQIKFGIDDDEIKKSAVMAARMNVQKDLLADVAKAAFQYSKVMGVDMSSATTAVVGGLEGMGRGFKKMGIEVDANKSQLENLNAILKGTQQGLKIAADEMQTAEGAQKRLSMWVGELEEKYGVAIVSNEKFIAALNQIGDTVMRAVEDGSLEQMADDIGTIAKAIADLIDITEKSQKYTEPFISFIRGDWLREGVDWYNKTLNGFYGIGKATEEAGDKAEAATPQVQGLTDSLSASGDAAEEAKPKIDLWGNTIEATTEKVAAQAKKWEDMNFWEKVYSDKGRFLEEAMRANNEAVKKFDEQAAHMKELRQQARESIAGVYLEGDKVFQQFLERQYPGIKEWTDKWKIASMDAGERVKYFYDQAHKDTVALADANSQAVQQMHMDWSIVENDVARFNERIRTALGLMDSMTGAGFMSPAEQETRARELLMKAQPGTAMGEALIQTALQMLQGAAQNRNDQSSRQGQIDAFLKGGRNPFSPGDPGTTDANPLRVKVVNNGSAADAFSAGLA